MINVKKIYGFPVKKEDSARVEQFLRAYDESFSVEESSVMFDQFLELLTVVGEVVAFDYEYCGISDYADTVIIGTPQVDVGNFYDAFKTSDVAKTPVDVTIEEVLAVKSMYETMGYDTEDDGHSRIDWYLCVYSS